MQQIYAYFDSDNTLFFGALFVMALGICGLVWKYFSTGKEKIQMDGRTVCKKELPFLRRLLAMPDMLILFGIMILGGAFLAINLGAFYLRCSSDDCNQVQGEIGALSAQYEEYRGGGDYHVDFSVNGVDFSDNINAFTPEERYRLREGQQVLVQYDYFLGRLMIYRIYLVEDTV